jgi:hypothetical protein
VFVAVFGEQGEDESDGGDAEARDRRHQGKESEKWPEARGRRGLAKDVFKAEDVNAAASHSRRCRIKVRGRLYRAGYIKGKEIG